MPFEIEEVHRAESEDSYDEPIRGCHFLRSLQGSLPLRVDISVVDPLHISGPVAAAPSDRLVRDEGSSFVFVFIVKSDDRRHHCSIIERRNSLM